VFARVSTFRVPPNQVEEAIHYIRDQVLPGAQQMEGFEGPFLLFDRDSGKALIVLSPDEGVRQEDSLCPEQPMTTSG
jgi:hypothetical protein